MLYSSLQTANSNFLWRSVLQFFRSIFDPWLLQAWMHNQQMQRASCKCKFAFCGEVEYFYVSLLSLQIKIKGKEGRKKRRPGERERERKRKKMHSFTLSISSNKTSMVWGKHIAPVFQVLMSLDLWAYASHKVANMHGTNLCYDMERSCFSLSEEENGNRYLYTRIPKGNYITNKDMRAWKKKKWCAQRQSRVGPLFDDPWETKCSVGTNRRPLLCREYLFQICFSSYWFQMCF